jgi:ATP synthase subunit K
MITLGTTATVPFLMGGKGGEKKTTPPINASSKDEEKFIQYDIPIPPQFRSESNTVSREFLQSVEQENNKAAAK